MEAADEEDRLMRRWRNWKNKEEDVDNGTGKEYNLSVDE